MGVFALREKIEGQLKKGVARPDVFNNMVKENKEQAAKIAYAIATIPKAPIPEKCMMANTTLLFLFICYSILTLVGALPLDLKSPTIFLAIQVTVPLVCMYFAFHYHGAIYRIIMLWFLVDFIEVIAKFRQDSLVEAIRILIIFAILVLSLYLIRKLFPHLRLLGPKMDQDGKYML